MHIDLITAIVIYQIIWWIVLFMVLPFGVRPTLHNAPKGTEHGAPQRPRIFRKLVATTLIATFFFGIAVYIIEAGWVRLRPTVDDIRTWEGQ